MYRKKFLSYASIYLTFIFGAKLYLQLVVGREYYFCCIFSRCCTMPKIPWHIKDSEPITRMERSSGSPWVILDSPVEDRGLEIKTLPYRRPASSFVIFFRGAKHGIFLRASRFRKLFDLFHSCLFCTPPAPLSKLIYKNSIGLYPLKRKVLSVSAKGGASYIVSVETRNESLHDTSKNIKFWEI